MYTFPLRLQAFVKGAKSHARMPTLAPLVVAVIALWLEGCGHGNPFDPRAPEGHGILARPDKAASKLQTTSNSHPFHLLSGRVFTRTLFVARDAPGLTIEIRDLAVAPGGAVHRLRLPTAALLEIRDGRGAISDDGRQLTMQGAPAAVAADSTLDITNIGQRLFVLRLYIVGGK